MITKSSILGGELLTYTVKLKQLDEAINRLNSARIACTVNLDVCYMLMSEAIKAAPEDQGDALKAFAYAISFSARQVRLEISQRPRWARMIRNISLDANKVVDIKIGTYRALESFAFRVFEDFDISSGDNATNPADL